MIPRAAMYNELQSELDRLFARMRHQASAVFNRAWEKAEQMGAVEEAYIESIHWDKGEECAVGMFVRARPVHPGGGDERN